MGEKNVNETTVDGFIQYMEELRRINHVTKTKLCKGICSTRFLLEFYKGEKRISQQLQNRLLERLGVGSDDLLYLVGKSDYACIKHQQKIIYYIRKRELDKAKSELDAYYAKYCEKRKFDIQFFYRMNSFIKILEGASKKEIRQDIKQAIEQTLPGFKIEKMDEWLLAIPEVDMLLDYYEYSDNPKKDIYENIIKYIKEQKYDFYGMSKLLPKAYVYYYGAVLRESASMSDEEWQKMVFMMEEALCFLKKAGSLTYLWEVLSILVDLYSQSDKAIEDNVKGNFCYSTILEWRDLIVKLYQMLGVDNESKETTVLYVTHNVKQVGEVIRSRRRLYGLSEEEACEGICETRTLERLEEGETTTQSDIVKLLLKRLNYPTDMVKDDVLICSVKAKQMIQQYRQLLMIEDYWGAKKLIHELKDSIDMSSSYNRQSIICHDAYIDYRMNHNKTEFGKRVEEGLNLTIPIEKLWESEKIVLTDVELFFVLQLFQIRYVGTDIGTQPARFLEKQLTAFEEDGGILNNAPRIIWLLDALQDYYKQRNDYERAVKMCREGVESLYLNRQLCCLSEMIEKLNSLLKRERV